MLSRVSKNVGKQLKILEQRQGFLSCEPLQYLCVDDDNYRYLLAVAITPLQTEVLQKEVVQNKKWTVNKSEYILKIIHSGFLEKNMYILFEFPWNLRIEKGKRNFVIPEEIKKGNLKEIVKDNLIPCICNELDKCDILHEDILSQETEMRLSITSIYKNKLFWDTESDNFKCFSIDLNYEAIGEYDKEKFAFQENINIRANEIYNNLQKVSIRLVGTTLFNVVPNIFFNTPSLFTDKAIIFEINEWNYSLHVQVVIEKRTARLYGFIMPISYRALIELIQFIFKEYSIMRIAYESVLYDVGANIEIEQALLILPDDMENLRANLSSKGKYNLKREKRLIEEKIGKYEVVAYDREDIPEDVITKYFEYKKDTHNRYYGMNAKEYIEQYHVTDAYVMYMNNKILAMCLSCEWNENVYFENFSYCTQYKNFSLGSVMYDLYLEELVNRRKKVVFLGNGKHSYKKRYGSIFVMTHSGVVYKNNILNLLNSFYRFSVERIKQSKMYKELTK